MRKVFIVLSTLSIIIGVSLIYLLRQDNTAINDCGGRDLITYLVRDNKLTDPTSHIEETPWNSFVGQTQTHQEIWRRITDIIPADLIKKIDTCVFSAGNESYSAFVQPASDSSYQKWVLNINVKTMHDPWQFISTCVHEFGHIITLNTDQIDYTQDEEDCPDRYIKDRGCSLPTSYINTFSIRFWKHRNKEWASYTNKEDYYRKYPDHFVSPYAATDNLEDIAESFTSFVYSKKPSGTTIADEKIKFFYDFPELVTLRTTILTRTHTYLQQ